MAKAHLLNFFLASKPSTSSNQHEFVVKKSLDLVILLQNRGWGGGVVFVFPLQNTALRIISFLGTFHTENEYRVSLCKEDYKMVECFVFLLSQEMLLIAHI